MKNKGRTKHKVEINIAVCILFFERLEQTLACIQSCLSSGVNIYVLNNGSSKLSRHALGEFCSRHKQIKIFDSNVNLGPGVGKNYLVTHTTEEWLLFLDNDIVVRTNEWVDKLARHIHSHKEIEVFIPKLFSIHDMRYTSFRSIRIVGLKAIHDLKITKNLTNTFPGGASFINRRLFDRLGLYDNRMFVGFEDFEMCIRAILLKNPVKGRLIHNIKLAHNHTYTRKKEDRAAVLARYDIGSLESSFNLMTEKHNVILESNWQKWVISQVEIILKDNNFTLKKNSRKWLANWIKNVLKRSFELALTCASAILPHWIKRKVKKVFHI